MLFQSAPCSLDTGYTITYASETGRWELGIWPVMFGFRVRAGLAGDGFVAVDYCAADQTIFLRELFAVVMLILEQLPEDTQPGELYRILPGHEVKPINQDPCWEKLQDLAKPGAAREALEVLRGGKSP